MDIVQLKTLIHVAELGSLSKAADRLNIAQPALSRQVRLLEQELGAPLFDRHGRGMIITEAGRNVLDHAARIMLELESLRSSVSKKRAVLRGEVSIGMTPTIAQIMTVPMVRSIRENAPDLAMRFSSAFTGYLIDWVRRGELDVAFSYDPQPSRSLRTTPLIMESLMLVGAVGDRLLIDQPVPFSQLAGVDLVLPKPPHGLRVIMDDCAMKAGIELTTTLEVDSYGPMIELVKAGVGMTVLPLAPIFEMVQSGVLTAAPLTDPAPERRLALVYSADRAVSPAARFVGECFSEIAADLVTRGIWSGRLLA